jgi:hypothetical protein
MPIQQEVIPMALAGRDVIGLAETGLAIALRPSRYFSGF